MTRCSTRSAGRRSTPAAQLQCSLSLQPTARACRGTKKVRNCACEGCRRLTAGIPLPTLRAKPCSHRQRGLGLAPHSPQTIVARQPPALGSSSHVEPGKRMPQLVNWYCPIARMPVGAGDRSKKLALTFGKLCVFSSRKGCTSQAPVGFKLMNRKE